MNQLDRIESELREQRKLLEMVVGALCARGDFMAILDDLIAQVAATEGEEASAASSYTLLAQAYEAAIAANDMPQIVALTARLKASAANLAAAVVANPPPAAPVAPSTPATPATAPVAPAAAPQSAAKK